MGDIFPTNARSLTVISRLEFSIQFEEKLRRIHTHTHKYHDIPRKNNDTRVFTVRLFQYKKINIFEDENGFSFRKRCNDESCWAEVGRRFIVLRPGVGEWACTRCGNQRTLQQAESTRQMTFGRAINWSPHPPAPKLILNCFSLPSSSVSILYSCMHKE